MCFNFSARDDLAAVRDAVSIVVFLKVSGEYQSVADLYSVILRITTGKLPEDEQRSIFYVAKKICTTVRHGLCCKDECLPSTSYLRHSEGVHANITYITNNNYHMI